MIDISMQASLLLYSLFFLIGFVFMSVYYFLIENRDKEYFYFLLFFLLSSLGSLMIVFRANLGVFLSIIVANSLLIFANISLDIGIKRLYKSPLHLQFYVIIYSIFLLLFLYFTYVDFNAVLRVYLYNLTVIGILGYALIFIMKRSNSKSPSELMSITLGFIIVAMLIRIILLMVLKENSTEFLSFSRDALSIVVVGVANLLIVAGLLSIVGNMRSQALSESERSKTSLISNLPGFVYRCLNDENWTMKYLSSGFTVLTGYERKQVIDNNKISYNDIIVKDFQDIVKLDYNKALTANRRYAGEYQIMHKNGETIWVWEQGVGIYNDNHECIAIEGFITNINDRKTLEKSLETLSFNDSLTGLYNRRFIEEQLKRLEKSRHIPISILIADINGLKFINDSFGHEQGDLFIQEVGHALKSTLREHEFVSRLSGDEFLVILENTTEQQAKSIVSRIQNNLKNNKYTKMGLSVAIGYATKKQDNQTLKDTRNKAEEMMYQLKMFEKPSHQRKTVDAVLSTLFERDILSKEHSQNVAKYSKALAAYIGLSEHDIKKTETAALLHDVGKIIIDDTILTSKELLTTKEYEEIKSHPNIGYRILSSVSELRDISDIILCHHERIDGKGYPNGLKNKSIPLISKIISICDAYDAMINKRLFKNSMSQKEALEELERCAGTQFDKPLVDSFIKWISNN